MRRLALLLGVAALVTGIWMMISSVQTDSVPVGFVENEEAGGPEPGSTPRTGEATGEEPVEVAEAVLDRSQVEAAEPGPAENSKLIRILVTRKDTGEPVPGAEVAYCSAADLAYDQMSQEEQKEYQQLGRDQEKLTRRFGTVELADSNGLAFIPVDEFAIAIGRHGAFYGQLSLRTDPRNGIRDEYELELERDLTLLVRVLDSRGKPAEGIPIALVPQWDEESSDNQALAYELAKTEGPEGLASIPHVQIMAQTWAQRGRSPDAYQVRPNIPGLTEGGARIDLEDPLSDPVVLQLPPTGSIVVETTDVHGNKTSSTVASVVLSTAPAEPPDDLRRYNPPATERWNLQPGKDGETVFDWVVTGRTYVTTAYMSTESLHRVVAGPVVNDQRVHVTLSLQNETYNIVGRVVDEELKPVRNAGLQVMYETDRGGTSGASLQTDEDGRFVVPLGRTGQDMTIAALAIQTQPMGGGPGKPFSMYSFRGPRQLAPGDNDLGDVVLETAPLVAAGRIVVDGKPTNQRWFNLTIQSVEIQQSRTATRERWQQDRGLNLTVMEEGRFEVRGVARATRYRFTMYGFGRRYLPIDPVPFAPGAEDLEIHLDSGGSLEAVVLLDETIPLQNLWLQLIPTEGQDVTTRPDPQDPLSRFMMRDGNGLRASNTNSEEERQTFRWGALSPGGYRLEVLPRGARRPLVAIPDVHITAGETSRDPRLAEIDLRGKLRKIAVKVIDADGEAIEDRAARPVVLFNDLTSGEDLQGYGFRNGPAVILTGESYVDLLVVARGYRPKEVFGVSSDVTVMLESYPKVLVRLVGAEPPENHTLQASVRRTQSQSPSDTRRLSYENGSGGLSSWLRPRTTVQEVGASREIALPVDGDGTYRVSAYVQNNTTRRSVRIRGTKPAEVQVRTPMGRQVFEIQILEEELSRAVEQAARGR